MKYLSVCSGIEAASVAWHPLGWEAVGFSEIEPFPCAVLASHYPDVKNYGDLTKHEQWNIEPGTVDVLIGGTPCQSFSVAGLRKGLADPRGNLALVYLALVNRIRPRWVVWENVPGVLSSNGGRDFGAFIGALGELRYGFSWRILDAQYWGVAQRRRRVFVVGCLDGWQRAASVLFERESCTWNYPPRRQKGKGIAADVAPCIGASGRGFSRAGETRGQDPVIACRDVTGPHDVAGSVAAKYGTGGGNTPLVTYAFEPGAMGRDSMSASAMKECSPCLRRDMGDNQPAVAYGVKTAHTSSNGIGIQSELTHTLDCASPPSVVYEVAQTITKNNASNVATAGNNCGVVNAIVSTFGVRRLTPVECERLQGFPDDYTNINFSNIRPDKIQYLADILGVKTSRILSKTLKPTADGPRYKALGNSMAVPVIRWIGERIAFVNSI